jgi:hypothetical protein
VRPKRPTRSAGLGLLLTFGIVAARAAAAQVAFGSPADPPRIALGAGVFDVIPDGKKEGSGPAALLWSEYRFGDVLWAISPFVGVSGTGKGAFYGYVGFGVDINLGGNWVLTPSLAGGYFNRGGGVDLGSWWEFRSGAELGWRLPDQRRLGVVFYHMSNAGLGKKNPGEESVTLVFTVPLQ